MNCFDAAFTKGPFLLTALLMTHAWFAQEAKSEPAITIASATNGYALRGRAAIPATGGSTSRLLFELQRTTDLRRWTPLNERFRSPSNSTDQPFALYPKNDEPLGFFRLLQVEAPVLAKLGQGGEEVFGYREAFARELSRIGQISPQELGALFPDSAEYLPGVSEDPTTAEYWDLFSADPAKLNANKEGGSRGYRHQDYRLSPAELALFKTNGFVVSERLGAASFADVFYALWHAELPVFISCDAILQAWHRTYDAILEELEETYLSRSTQQLLESMAGELPNLAAIVGNGLLRDSVLDADYFLTVGRNLLAETNTLPVATSLGQDPKVRQTLDDIRSGELRQVSDFMGFCRIVDFSQFQPRGHYARRESLRRYFQAMMWLGRIDFPVAGGPWIRCHDLPRLASTRELGVAILLWDLLHRSGQFKTWQNMERILSLFVGPTDSLNFGQLGGLLAGAGVRSVADANDSVTLARLQDQLLRGELGLQNIRSDWFQQPFGSGISYALPQTFTFLGQRFVPDSWMMSQSLYDSVSWLAEGRTNRVPRRVSGALDVAFAVLGNNQVVPELIVQMEGRFADSDRVHALQFRDGLPYQHNLAATRLVIDQQQLPAWEQNLYSQWLYTLRALSAPTTDPNYPEVMRTRAWAMKSLNTQLASWTQLRHQTVLYAKQALPADQLCLFPKGWIEPRIEFWNRLQRMATMAADQIALLPVDGSYAAEGGGFLFDLLVQTNSMPLSSIQNRQVAHLRQFASTVGRLKELAVKELAGDCFTSDDEHFVDSMLGGPQGMAGCGVGAPRAYQGWYPRLFYRTVYWPNNYEFHLFFGAGAKDALVSDVQTDVPCEVCGDPGSVLYEGVGQVHLLLMAANHGGDRFICAGPVFSHYEFEVIGPHQRLGDDQWRLLTESNFRLEDLPSGILPTRIEGLRSPPWTRSFLAPNTVFSGAP